MKKYISALSAMAVAVSASAFTSSALSDKYDDVKYIKPALEQFNENDVNGRVTLVIPRNAQAKVDITFKSPEFDSCVYYSKELKNGTFYFDIEGYSNTEDDYREYTVNVNLYGGKFGLGIDYSDTFTVPDGDEEPDSFRELKYSFKLDNTESDAPWEYSVNEENTKEIKAHINYVKMGDIDGNTRVDASDASDILQEYASLSTGNSYRFTTRQRIAADVNGDGKIDSSDASKVLTYYSLVSTNGNVDGIFSPAQQLPADDTTEG